MNSRIRKFLSLMLAALMAFGTASAYSSNQVKTQFEYVLKQIEDNSLYTQKKEMPRAEIDRWNAYLQQHPDQFHKVVNDYLKTLDSHSVYLSKKDYNDGFSQLVGYVGVGIGMQQTPDGVVITHVNRAGPADVVGIKVGDRIVAVDGKDASKMTQDALTKLLRGEAGTKVAITIDRGGQKKDFILTRSQIHHEYVTAQTVSDGVEYIRVEAMGSEEDLHAFQSIWNGLDEKNTRAVILDLRGNGGGLIADAWGMADCILERKGEYMGAIQWREDQGGLEKHWSTGGGLPLNQICVLVDENTASAAELLAGILKEVGGAEVLGTTTYGKGQGQYHLTMMDGVSKLVVTCLEMHLPETGCWEGKGIAPTRTVRDDTSVSAYLARLPKIDRSKIVRYGEKSEEVRALSGRLFLLGYAKGASDVFDTEMLSALRRFQRDEGLTPGIAAGAGTFEAIDRAMIKLAGNQTQLDNVYFTALDLCKQAAAKPQRYQTTTNGNWRAA